MAAPLQSAFSRREQRLRSCALSPFDAARSAEAGRVLAGLDPWRSLGYSGTALSSYLAREDGALHRYAASVGEADAGVLCVRFPWLLGPYIELIALYPGFQGRGIGRELIEWIAAEVQGRSGNLWATVSSFNTRGRRFWASVGFREIAPLEDLVAPGRREILLRKILTRASGRNT